MSLFQVIKVWLQMDEPLTFVTSIRHQYHSRVAYSFILSASSVNNKFFFLSVFWTVSNENIIYYAPHHNDNIPKFQHLLYFPTLVKARDNSKWEIGIVEKDGPWYNFEMRIPQFEPACKFKTLPSASPHKVLVWGPSVGLRWRRGQTLDGI